MELREITESRAHSIGSPKMVLTVTSEPKPGERQSDRRAGDIGVRSIVSDHSSQVPMMGGIKVRGRE